MRKLHPVMALLLALAVSTFVAACGGEKDNQREALEKESLQKELDLALQTDSTVQPQLQDVARDSAVQTTPPPVATATAPAPRPSAPERRPEPRRPAPRPTQPRREEPAPAPREPAPTPAPARSVTRTAPAGTQFAVNINQQLSTHGGAVGETFTATLSEPIVASDGTTMIPAGATVNGRITESRASNRAGEEAVLRITFTSISSGGNTYPIAATTVDVPSKLVTRDSNATKAAKVGGGAVVGAILGRVIGGKSTKATIAGAAVGAAAGTAVAMGTADVDRVIPAGSRATVRLDGPVRVTEE
jgi:outer membrane biosynthesis protein TonB